MKVKQLNDPNFVKTHYKISKKLIKPTLNSLYAEAYKNKVVESGLKMRMSLIHP